MKSLASWGALSLLAAPLGAWALSLGEIDIRSALNQPLEAEIELTATAEEMQSLDVSLASAEAFARYGLDRPGFLATLEFRVGTNAAGRNAIFVTSRQSIAEPFVELLVEATARSGRLLRQYTVFLDPPTFLQNAPMPAGVEPPRTREPAASAPAPSVAGGALPRPQPRPAPQAAPAPEAPQPVRSAATPGTGAGGTYGPVQNAETLWGIATQFRPGNVSMNQMMVAIYQANPQAFDGNMNILRRGAILRIPELAELQRVAASSATAEVQRHTDTWQGAAPQQARLILVPPSENAASAPAGREGGAGTENPAEVEALRDEVVALQSELEQSRRLLEVRNEEFRALQEQLARGPEPQAPDARTSGAVDPGNELESEPLFADEVPPVAVESPGESALEAPSAETPSQSQPQAAATAVAPPPAPTPGVTPTASVTTPPEPSLVDRALAVAATPIVWIAAGGAVVLLGLLLFVRRRRASAEDVTGQWEALQAEVDDDVEREATARMRRQVQDDDFLVHEQHAEPDDDDDETAEEAARPAERPAARPRPVAAAPHARAEPREPELADQTLSSQTVINLDQADPIAEADFHMAYGLYDQAADLVTKALNADPDSRELKLKLLEVYFVWGNKESFLASAQALREEMGERTDPDWDKVIIMGKQICPDEPLFAEATAAAGEVDLDLEAGDAPALDLAFESEEGAAEDVDLDFGFGGADADLEIAATGERKFARAAAAEEDLDLDIGARTQAGLEEALTQLDEESSQTTPDLDIDSLAATQESPTVETPRSAQDDDEDWAGATMENPTIESSSPVTATVQTTSFDDDSDDLATVETPTIEGTFSSLREQEDADHSASGEYTAELNLDDLGLDVEDIEALPGDLGELPSADEAESDTREQPRLGEESDLLSATGVTQVLREDDEDAEQLDTAVLDDEEATLMAPGFDRMSSTEVIEQKIEAVGSADGDDALDLNLDDFSAALGGGDTVEQPRGSSFDDGIFGGGDTPIDLDVGADVRGDEEPTGTEEVGLDPQTMTEVGTKLDLARAYIDMGDPEGARSILEEVLDEGDSGQRREAQSLIDALPA